VRKCLFPFFPEGADDKATHDTVLIAAAFCRFNRYVDGPATWAPRDAALHDRIGARLAREGYLAAARPQTGSA